MAHPKTITPRSAGDGERRRVPSLTDQVYERVREDIIHAVLRPGTTLLEPDLARNYGVSKTPVREALRLLVQEGWVTILPRKGYLVRPLRLEDISEVFGLRMIIEPPLVADVARSGGPRAVGLLRQRLDEQKAPEGDLEASLTAARLFHLAGAQMAHNRRAENILEGLLAEVRRLHHLMPVVEAHITSSVEIEAHTAILQAVQDQDADTAASLMKEHIAEVARTIVDAFTTLRMG